MDQDEFLEAVNDVMKCVICADVLVKPMCCGAGHAFCNGCIARWLAEKPECPVDRSRLTAEFLSYNRPLETAHHEIIVNMDSSI